MEPTVRSTDPPPPGSNPPDPPPEDTSPPDPRRGGSIPPDTRCHPPVEPWREGTRADLHRHPLLLLLHIAGRGRAALRHRREGLGCLARGREATALRRRAEPRCSPASPFSLRSASILCSPFLPQLCPALFSLAAARGQQGRTEDVVRRALPCSVVPQQALLPPLLCFPALLSPSCTPSAAAIDCPGRLAAPGTTALPFYAGAMHFRLALLAFSLPSPSLSFSRSLFSLFLSLKSEHMDGKG